MTRLLFKISALAAPLAAAACGAPGHVTSATADGDSTRVVGASMRDEAIPPDRASFLLPPTQLRAGGAPIDTGELIGYAGPTAHDYDGDGRIDLIVGAFVGKLQLFRNTGSATIPEFGAGSFLQADGEDIEISNW